MGKSAKQQPLSPVARAARRQRVRQDYLDALAAETPEEYEVQAPQERRRIMHAADWVYRRALPALLRMTGHPRLAIEFQGARLPLEASETPPNAEAGALWWKARERVLSIKDDYPLLRSYRYALWDAADILHEAWQLVTLKRSPDPETDSEGGLPFTLASLQAMSDNNVELTARLWTVGFPDRHGAELLEDLRNWTNGAEFYRAPSALAEAPDWRPAEAIPEDYYTLNARGAKRWTT